MKVNKIVIETKPEEIIIKGASLLSVEEAKTLLSEKERVYKTSWWLRTKLKATNDIVCTIGDRGYINYVGQYVFNCERVRPTLIIDISNSDIKVGDVFVFAGKIFKVLSPEIAWMYNSDIGSCVFQKDYKREDANIYETSEMKKFVDAWFESAIRKEGK